MPAELLTLYEGFQAAVPPPANELVALLEATLLMHSVTWSPAHDEAMRLRTGQPANYRGLCDAIRSTLTDARANGVQDVPYHTPGYTPGKGRA